MHELSLIANLFEIMEEKAHEKNAKKIVGVKLQVGQLSGAVPEFLKTAFDIYKKDTIADKATLEIEEIPFRIRCLECEMEMIKDDFALVCSRCQSSNLKTLSGTDLILQKIDIET